MIQREPTDHSFDKYDEPRLHMERLVQARLVEFDISMRILYPLDKAGIKTLGDLVKQSPRTLRQIPQIGKTSVDTIEEFLTYHKLSLAK